MALIGRDLDPRAGDHVVQGAPRQLAVVGEALGVEQHMALGGIGAAIGHQAADHLHHRLDMGCGPRLKRGAQGAQGVHVGVVGRRELVGDHRDRHAAIHRGLIYLVVHVGDVAGVDHRVLAIEPAQQAEDQVEDHHRARIADMGVVIDGGAADIHRHPARIARGEDALFAAQGVLDDEGHEGLSGSGRLNGASYSGRERARPWGCAFVTARFRGMEAP